MLYSLVLFAQAEQSIVFVGNSYTQYNALPSQVDSTWKHDVWLVRLSNVTSLTVEGSTLPIMPLG